jgi:hypothetical protein
MWKLLGVNAGRTLVYSNCFRTPKSTPTHAPREAWNMSKVTFWPHENTETNGDGNMEGPRPPKRSLSGRPQRIPLRKALTNAIETGKPEEVSTQLDLIRSTGKVEAIYYVYLLVDADNSKHLDESSKQAMRNAVFRDIQAHVLQDGESSSSGVSNAQNGTKSNPASKFGSPELSIVHNVFLQQALPESGSPESILNPERVHDLWRFEQDRLLQLPGVLKDVVMHGTPQILRWALEIINRRPISQKDKSAIICDFGTDQYSGTALTAAISKRGPQNLKFVVEFVKVLIQQETDPHLLDIKNPHFTFKETPLHTIVKDKQKDEAFQEVRRELVRQITNHRPMTLHAHDHDGYPPFYYAKSNQLPDIEVLLRDSIFEKLEDVYTIRQALYGPGGKFQSHMRDFDC